MDEIKIGFSDLWESFIDLLNLVIFLWFWDLFIDIYIQDINATLSKNFLYVYELLRKNNKSQDVQAKNQSFIRFGKMNYFCMMENIR